MGTKKVLEILSRRLGHSAYKIIIKGIKLFLSIMPASLGKKIPGAGCVETGIIDLGSNKKHLKGFGK